MKKFYKIVIVFILIGLLVIIRAYEESLFYDPLIQFFKTDHTTGSLPAFDSLKLLGNISIRFFTNSIISLGILWFIFNERGIVKLSALLLSILYVLLLMALCYLLFFSNSNNYVPLFYVRRFLIQPVFILILLPAFYFHKRK